MTDKRLGHLSVLIDADVNIVQELAELLVCKRENGNKMCLAHFEGDPESEVIRLSLSLENSIISLINLISRRETILQK